MLRRVWGSINHLRLKRFNLRPVRLKSACTSHPAQEASLGTVGSGCSPDLLAGFGLRCTALALHSFLSHTVDGLQSSLHTMKQRAGSSQIFGHALSCRAREQAGDPAASMQPASHKPGACFRQSAAAGLAFAWEGMSSDPEKPAAVGSPSQCWGKSTSASLGSELCYSVVLGRRGLPRAACRRRSMGWEVRAPFESPYLPSLSGNPQGGRPGNLYHSCLGLAGDTQRQWSQNLKWGSSVHP